MTQTKKTNNKENTTSNTRLSVQVALTGLSFLVSDVDTGASLYFTEKRYSSTPHPEEIQTDIEELLEQEELDRSYKEVVLVYATDVYTLVPGSLFDETKASEYLKFNSKILANDYVAHDRLEGQEQVVVYVPYMNVNNFMFDRFGTFKYYHSLSVLLTNWLTKDKYSVEPRAYMHVMDGAFDLLVTRDGKLALANTYSFRTPEDFIYYVLFSFEQLTVNPDQIETQVCGAIRREDAIFEILYKYVRNVDFTPAPELRIDHAPDHFHFVLKHLS